MTFQPIISAQNERIKQLGKLQQPKYRRELGLFLVENAVIIFDALSAGQDFEALFVTEEFIAKNQNLLEFLAKESKSREFYLISDKINRAFSELNTPSGIVATYKIAKQKIDKNSVIYLDGVSDPGNLGAIMRNALAFGFYNLVLSPTCVDIYSAKTISAAKDAIFKLNILEDRTGEWLGSNQLPLLATSSHVGVALRNFQAPEKFCLILGSESHGILPELLAVASQKIKIPISDKIESLNVAAAAAILFYELSPEK